MTKALLLRNKAGDVVAETLVSDDDYETYSKARWSLVKGYARGWWEGKVQSLHRLIVNAPDGYDVDHKDGDTLNNQPDNLRVCTTTQNNANQAKQAGRSSQYKGVSFETRRQKWVAHIQYSGKQYNLGYHVSEVDAARAYDNKAIELFGEFAKVNLPR